MITDSDLRKFLGDSVSIGVNHRSCYDRLFFFYGFLVDINKQNVKLKLDNDQGFRIIPIEEIQEIKRRVDF